MKIRINEEEEWICNSHIALDVLAKKKLKNPHLKNNLDYENEDLD